MDLITLPFRIPNVLGGFAEVNGILQLVDSAINIEIQTSDNLVKLIKSEVKIFSIPLSDIVEINYKKSIWGNKLIIQVAKMSSLADLPSHESGEITLSIDKKHSEFALQLVRAIDPTSGVTESGRR